MKCKLLCKLKGLFGIYTPGCEYWVDLKDIDIPINFLRHHPRQEKWNRNGRITGKLANLRVGFC